MTLYTDDLLVCLGDPEVSIPILLEYINSFRSISGYTTNWGKSEFMPLTDQLSDDFLTKLPFRAMKECFTYLGLKLTKNPKHLFKFNCIFFKKLDAIILPFVWGYSKSHRISKAHLHKPSIKGGLGLPVFKHYYWAASSRALADWKCGGAKVDENPLWVQLEAAAVKMSSLPARPLYDSTSVAKSVRRIYTLKN